MIREKPLLSRKKIEEKVGREQLLIFWHTFDSLNDVSVSLLLIKLGNFIMFASSWI